MPTLLAIEMTENTATLVTADSNSENQSITIQRVDKISLNTNLSLIEEINGRETSFSPTSIEENSSDFTAEHTPLIAEPLKQIHQYLNIELNDIDATMAIIPSRQLFFGTLSLPFSDQKKLQQVVPLQLQDLVPFETDTFVIDSIVLGKNGDANYKILSSLVPAQDVQYTLESLKNLGTEPKLVTSKASAISALADLCLKDQKEPFVILAYVDQNYSLAIFSPNELELLREFSHLSTSDYSYINHEIICTIKRAERNTASEIKNIYTIGAPPELTQLLNQTNLKTAPIILSDHVNINPTMTTHLDDISWAVGLFANETLSTRKTPRRVLNFRQGIFSYKPTLNNLLSSIQAEKSFILAALIFGIIFIMVKLYAGHRMLANIDNAIFSRTHQVFTDIPIPKNQEISFLQNQVEDLENKLRNLGTLSSLSPLESLKVLSSSLDPKLDIEIDGMNLGHGALSFGGTAANAPSVAKLETLLRARADTHQIFCGAKVDSKGLTGEGNRQSFRAEITLCD